MHGLYHKDIGLPKAAVRQVAGKTFPLRLTNHARNACQNDRYGAIVPPNRATVTPESIIELEIVGGVVSKVVTRQSYDATKDIIVVFIPERGQGVCKTFWFNLKTDTHKTLDKSKYVNPYI